MKDKDFLIWIHARLEKVHKESPLVDYMNKLRAIISECPKDKETPNDGRGKNSLEELTREERTTVTFDDATTARIRGGIKL